MNLTCKNCAYPVDGRFCSNCGQTVATHTIDYHYVLHEIQHGILHVDKGILYTIKELFTRPGATIKEYIEGKRIKHFKPLAFVLILATLYAILMTVTQEKSMLHGILDGWNSQGKSENLFTQILQWLIDHYAYTTVLFIPIISLASYVAFRKTNYNYFEHLVLNSFLAGQRIVAMLVSSVLLYFLSKAQNSTLSYFIGNVPLLLFVMLTSWSYYQFFDTVGPWQRVGRTGLSFILLLAVTLLLTISIVVVATMVDRLI